MALDEPVRVVAREPGLDEREQQPLAEEEAAAELEVARASARAGRRGPRRARRTGRACSRARGTRPGSTTRSAEECEMSRSCQSATFSRPTTAAARTTRARPQIRSATTGFRLCGIADEPFWPLPNGSCTSATSVRARWRISSAKRSSEAAATASAAEQLGVPVALDDLRRRRLGLEPEPLAGDALDLGIDRRVVADRARELADAHALERPREPAPGAVELEGPDRELEAERRRLGVDAVRAADRQRQAVLLRALHDGGERPVDPLEDQLARLPDLERERRVDDVRGGQPVVEPAAGRRRARSRRRRRRRRGRGASSPRSRPRARASAAPPSRGSPRAASAGTAPTSAQPSSAASSTSSQRSSLPSSDQILAMAGRE